MATNKTYTVVKDGETMKELKSLSAAKKLADTEGAEVFCDGALVYAATVKEAEPAQEEKRPDLYRLTSRMYIRKGPSKKAEKLGIAEPETVVEVAAVEGDWLHLTDGTFILYDGGKFAQKL